jgi:hypothetical protein
MLNNSVKDYIIPETTFEVAFGEDREGINYIDGEASQIVNMDGKTGVIGGEVTVKHIDNKYDITVDLINHLQHRIRAHYRGELRHGMVGYEVVTPTK